MDQSFTILCHTPAARQAMKKVTSALFDESPFVFPDLVEPPADIDPKEYLVSEAMKQACHEDKPVIIVGVEKEEIFEDDISCDKFHALVSFLSPHRALAESMAIIDAYQPQKKLVCGQPEPCTALGGIKSDTYAGRIIYDICHKLSNISGFDYTRVELDKFLSILPAIRFIDTSASSDGITLFIPLQNGEADLISLFMQEMQRLGMIAETGNADEFGHEYDDFYENEQFYRFPFLGGDF
jgi:hypothetical protein